MRRLPVTLAGLLIAGLLLTSPAAAQTPTVAGAYTVGAGSATTDFTGTTITIGSPRTILDFSSFNLAAGQTLNFRFNARSDTALIRVASGAGEVHGTLNAMVGATGTDYGGNLWLDAPSGVTFGSTTVTNVGGLHATTAQIENADFTDLDGLDGNDLTYNFAAPTPIGPSAIMIQPGAQVFGHGGPLSFVGSRVSQDAASTIGPGVGASENTEVAYGSASGYTLEVGATSATDHELLELVPTVAAPASALSAIDLQGSTEAADVFVAALGSGAVTIGNRLRATRAPASGGGDVVVAAGGGITRSDAFADPRATRASGAPAQALTLQHIAQSEDLTVLRATGDLTMDSPGGEARGAEVALATDGLFVNEMGSSAISGSTFVPTPKWAIYAPNPGAIGFAGPDSQATALWNRDIDDISPGAAALGNKRYVFQHQPTLTFRSLDADKTVFEQWEVEDEVNNAWDFVGGLQLGVPGVFLGDSEGTAYSGTPDVSSIGEDSSALVSDDPDATDDGPYVMDIEQGTGLTSPAGYGFAFQDLGRLNVLPLSTDHAPPTVSFALDGTLGDNGWHRSDVHLTWEVADTDTPNDVVPDDCDPSAVTTDGTASFKCSAIADGRRRSRTVTIKRDTVAPAISASATSGGAAYREGAVAADDVVVTFACTDATSGTSRPPAQTITAEGETPLVGGVCKDNAGNVTRTWFGPVRIARPKPPVAQTVTQTPTAPLPSDAQTRSVFRAQLSSAVSTLRKLGLSRLRTRGYTRQLAADQAGVASEDILGATRGARAAAAKPVVLARGTARFTAAGKKAIKVKPTKAGKRALRGKRSMKVTVRTTFRPASGAKAIVVRSKATTIRRR